MITNLALYIIDTNDIRFIRVMDISCYTGIITGEKLLVKAPGFTKFKEILVAKNFSTLISSVNLHVTPNPTELIDGIYTMRYSISPNESNWVEYKHLRTVNILHRYYKQLMSLEIDCNYDRDKDKRLAELRNIKSYIDAAKAYIEYGNSPERGMNLYEYASKKLSNIENKNCIL